jgi:hypothetical protein
MHKNLEFVLRTQIILSPPGYDPGTVQPVAKCYTDYVIVATSLHYTNITFMNMPVASAPLPGTTFFRSVNFHSCTY